MPAPNAEDKYRRWMSEHTPTRATDLQIDLPNYPLSCGGRYDIYKAPPKGGTCSSKDVDEAV